jgi:hypothetical protein
MEVTVALDSMMTLPLGPQRHMSQGSQSWPWQARARDPQCRRAPVMQSLGRVNACAQEAGCTRTQPARVHQRYAATRHTVMSHARLDPPDATSYTHPLTFHTRTATKPPPPPTIRTPHSTTHTPQPTLHSPHPTAHTPHHHPPPPTHPPRNSRHRSQCHPT